MAILALETATDACSVALLVDGVTTERYVCAPREHAARVLVMVDELLAEANLSPTDVEAIAFGKGPGSFLGTRIAASIAQSLALCWGCQLLPISTLAALAMQCYRQAGSEHILSAWDARMQGVYWGDYRCVNGLMFAEKGDCLWSPSQFYSLALEEDFALVGNAWSVYKDELPEYLVACIQEHILYPRALDLLAYINITEEVSLSEATPVYLRHPVTH